MLIKTKELTLDDITNDFFLMFNSLRSHVKEVSLEYNSDETSTITFAHTFCAKVIEKLWFSKLGTEKELTPLPTKISLIELNTKAISFIQDFRDLFSEKDVNIVGYYIGKLYTTLLPKTQRSKYGVYYTPPSLVNRLINSISELGFEWNNARILDPACGGAAFLTPVTLKFLNTLRSEYNNDITTLLKNINGFEIDPFAAWASQVLFELSIYSYFPNMLTAPPRVVQNKDALFTSRNEYNSFDLVIGNPPFGKITLTPELKKIYSETVFGHANLYGMFAHLAVNLCKPHGYIAFVMPTSFLGGQYFKSLRLFLSSFTQLISIDFINDRIGVFDDVLQETSLVVFKKQTSNNHKTLVNLIQTNKADGNTQTTTHSLGKYKAPFKEDRPWLFPRSFEQIATLKGAKMMSNNLTSLGLKISTGQLVWNRHKNQIAEVPQKDTYPLIWAESVLSDGTFQFRSDRNNHKPYIKLFPNQDFLITKEPCILVQRTTAKEQQKRIICAEVPGDFLHRNPKGFVVENHLNILKQNGFPLEISLHTIAAVLNSQAVDRIFRCISGSVAVSAYELNAIPLPDIEMLIHIEEAINMDAPEGQIEKIIESIYEGYI
jgi:tRNA1(Val) A37 N6-methylase TrmN6